MSFASLATQSAAGSAALLATAPPPTALLLTVGLFLLPKRSVLPISVLNLLDDAPAVFVKGSGPAH